MTAALEGGEWSAARPSRTLPPGKTRYPFYRSLGGPQGWSGQVRKISSARDSIPDRPTRSQSQYRLSYPVLTDQHQITGGTRTFPLSADECVTVLRSILACPSNYTVSQITRPEHRVGVTSNT